ncbi:peptide chain release factor 2 [candidate division WWE3 bacterium RIFCSPHIGHO2_01_FULL_40_23]|uniref:Peptide chain release factor 2 n=1 Tax=candidate division WWE3 bacterium RIFCSPLOWO2_01_FULL_41_18 TaxID=1802625 RepID=A0A1F4VDQ5_UNCKA|nr:MAG: peptide chain release factor 2 [candidate division WWE3 bacterium RIFCSPHIGHO2_01_FULL_40_23]OGC55297.1 MAG: peptide chain release factor 2 [candidate division WWE3 bacterium RIFCSPLOWO2_01_FULL_41_18]
MNEQRERFEKLKSKLGVSEKKKRLEELSKKASSEDLWKDFKKGQVLMQELSSLKKELEDVDLIELYLESEEEVELESLLKKLEIKAFLSGKYDKESAILSIHAGQGGTEACDWASTLLRMYLRYAEAKGFSVMEIDKTPGEEVGVKSITYEVDGEYAYGYLKKEAGTHRLVRLSPFNANNLRQTSFALVEVLPVINEDIEVDIKPEDLEFEAIHSSGHGGQNVNKVSTAVRLRHKPTGIVVECQTERYQGRNRELALRVLRGKLYAVEEEKLSLEKKALKGEHKSAGWGNQIRSYVLQPYKLVKDLRTNFESTNPEAVLDGNLDDFIEAEIKL